VLKRFYGLSHLLSNAIGKSLATITIEQVELVPITAPPCGSFKVNVNVSAPSVICKQDSNMYWYTFAMFCKCDLKFKSWFFHKH